MMNVVNAVALAAATAVTFTSSVEAHGWIEKPLARHLAQGDQISWQQSKSGGNGARGMVDAGQSPYGGVPGLCGEPFEAYPDKPMNNFAQMSTEPQEVYQQGGIMTTQVDVGANHGGFWEISICDSLEISQECFDRNKLKTVEKDSEQWHILTRTIDNPNSKRPEVYIMDWKLPEGLACEHCVVQWTWWTAHNCLFECEESVCGFYANRKNDIVRPGASWDYKLCETKYPSKGQQPQIFRNCADIKIEGPGGGTPTTETTGLDTETPASAPDPVPVASEEAGCSTMSRRFLLGDQVLEEEDDAQEDISGAGNGMNCGNKEIEEALVEINKMRKEVKAQPLECSNRAVGVAENFSEIMHEQGKELLDTADSEDNCNLAGFGKRCSQTVAIGDQHTPLLNLEGIDREVLVEPQFAVAGAGYFHVEGITYWTLLLG